MPAIAMPGPAVTRATDGGHLKESTEYEEVAVIGNGAYGTVYKGRETSSGDMVALKKVRIPLSEEGVPTNILREISLLRQLEKFKHRNVVRLLDVCHGLRSDQEQNLILVFEHIDQDLATFLQRCPPPGLGPIRIKDLMRQILSGVEFLHANRVIHRDLKPQNILVTNNGEVKIADFGLARIYDTQIVLTSVVVTLWYRSPEVLLGSSYASPVDVWSCGCIFAELFQRRVLFSGQSEPDQLSKIFDIIGLPPESDWPENVCLPWTSFRYKQTDDIQKLIPEIDDLGKDLMMEMLQFRPSDRVTALQALNHPYFKEEDVTRITPSNNRCNPAAFSRPGVGHVRDTHPHAQTSDE